MKRRFNLLLVFILFLQLLPAQSFYKIYEEFNIIGYSLEAASDGGFIVGGSSAEGQNKEKLFIGKFASDGSPVWHHFVDAPHPFSIYECITILNDGSIILTGSSSGKLALFKYSQNGDLIWSKEFSEAGEQLLAAGTAELPNGNLISAAFAQSSNKTKIYSLSSTGTLTSSSTFYNYNLDIRKESLSFKKIHNDLLLFSSNRIILAVNANADSLWKNRYNDQVNSVLPTNDGNILAGGDKLRKLNYSGEEIWEKDPEYSVRSGFQKSSGEFYFFQPQRNLVARFNVDGNRLSNFEIDGIIYSITQNNDSPLIISVYTTENFRGFTLIKTNENEKAIYFIEPNGSEFFSSSDKIIPKWFKVNVDNVNIDLSTNGGNNWKSIIKNFHAPFGYYEFVPPYTNSDQCMIRILDSDDFSIRDQSDSLFSISRYQEVDYIAANEVLMYIGNNGMSAHNPYSDDAGFYWPGGEGATITSIYVDGILIGGKINGEPRVHGSHYRYGLNPGVINPDGTPANPNDIKYQIYKIKKGWELLPSGDLRDKYEFNHNNWPVDAGAPYFDFNEDGEFTPGIDGPAYYGDETLYYVANDMDSNVTQFLFGSPTVGLEFQTTLFARPDEGLQDAVFKKVKVINKSGETFEDVYFSYWADDDMGDANDDVIGCDTTLNLGFTYNGDDDDLNYYGPHPPAVGHLMIQGPKVPGEPDDSARYSNGWVKGYKNLPMTAFHFYIGSSSIYSDPDLGTYAGTNQVYNQMQGNNWYGDPIIDPTTGNPTTFCLYGDPVEGTGWYDGQNGWPVGYQVPGDRRYLMSSGPFTMAPGDTQEVVYAIYMARGSDRLNSLTKLKEKAVELVEFYNGDFITSVDDKIYLTPSEFVLYQNYPNPFNPTTKIKFSIPTPPHPSPYQGEGDREGLFFSLLVYDILGRKVATLLNKPLQSGTYEIEFDGSNLPSGVYMYQLKTASFIETKKMLLLK